MGNAFGVTSVPGFSPGLTLPQALSNTRTDGLGALYREGTASFLNSLVNNKFPFTTDQVKDRFASSLHSNKAAATQAHLFKMANEGKMKPRLWNWSYSWSKLISLFDLVCQFIKNIILRFLLVCGILIKTLIWVDLLC